MFDKFKWAILLGVIVGVSAVYAEDLTVAKGSTFLIETNSTYATVNVSGTLTIADGKTLTVTTQLNIGPNDGDTAIINVLGNANNSLKATKTVIGGASGGTGKVVAMNSTESKISGYGGCVVLNNLIITKNNTHDAMSVIDVLELGSISLDMPGNSGGHWTNNSSTPVRLRVKNGRIGGASQSWNNTYFTGGSFIVEGYDETSSYYFGNTYGPTPICGSSTPLTLRSQNQDVCLRQECGDSNYDITFGNVTWDGVRNLVLQVSSQLVASDMTVPHGAGAGIVRVTGSNARLKLGSRTVHINGLEAPGPSKSKGAVVGDDGCKLVFGDEDVDGSLSGHIKAVVAVEKIGSGTLTVNGTASCGTFTLSAGTLRVTSAFEVETINVAEGATLEIDGVTFTPSVGASIRGNLVLKNGGKFVSHSVITCDETVRVSDFCSYTSLTKEGTGTYVMVAPYAVSPYIIVKEGTLAFSAAGSEFINPGVEKMPATAKVRVDAGATLDFTAVTGGQVVNCFETDPARGVGTLTNASIAAAGTIALVNVTNNLDAVIVTPTLVNAQNVANVQNWGLTVNGVEYPKGLITYDSELQACKVSLNVVRLTSSGAGAIGLSDTVPTTAYVESGVVYTNTAALTGDMKFCKYGAGQLVLSQPSPNYSGDVLIDRGVVEAVVSNAFGTGKVTIRCTGTSTSQIMLSPTVYNLAFDNDFIFDGDSSDSYRALCFVTSPLKKIEINGKVTATGNLSICDSGKSTGQGYSLVYFWNDMTVPGTLSYPCSVVVQWKGVLRTGKLYGSSNYPLMGLFRLANKDNTIGIISLNYTRFDVDADNAMGGAMLYLAGTNNEEGRGYVKDNGYSQTLSCINQESTTLNHRAFYGHVTTATTLTLTGGTSSASCQLRLISESSQKTPLLSLVVDAGNDDFTQIFQNVNWTTRGDLTVRNGTLCLNGTFMAQNIPAISVSGGALEINTTSSEAFHSVTNITVGAAARLRIAASATDVVESPNLSMASTSTLELPAGAELTVNRARIGKAHLAAGTYTGADGTGNVLPQISGAGTLTVQNGIGTMLLLR